MSEPPHILHATKPTGITVAEAIAWLSKLPPDAELRITRPYDVEQSCNSPAKTGTYDEMGPLKYVQFE
jgi:hypothetical protein